MNLFASEVSPSAFQEENLADFADASKFAKDTGAIISSNHKAELLKNMGAKEVINYTTNSD